MSSGRSRRGGTERAGIDPGQKGERQFSRASAFGPGLGFDGQDGGVGVAAGLFLAEAAVLAIFEERVQDRRAGRRQAVEVVQQDDPFSGGGDQAGAVFAGVGERASLVAEEDAAEERFVGQFIT